MNEIYQSGVTEEVSSEGGTPMVPTVLLTATIPIGLTLVQRLVKLHGGSVEARIGGIGRGSEFIVRLPVLTGPVVAPPQPALPPASTGPETRHRMLIVDDNEDSARSMATLQSRRNYETRTAFTGPTAVAAASEFAPEVVLLDIGLPGMDGFEVAGRLRAIPTLDGAFLVAMSGYPWPTRGVAH
jgi:two-component system CheB/CheR fusion protein